MRVLIVVLQSIIGWSVLLGIPVLGILNAQRLRKTLKQYALTHGLNEIPNGFRGTIHGIPIECELLSGKGFTLTFTIDTPQSSHLSPMEARTQARSIVATMPRPRPHVMNMSFHKEKIVLSKSCTFLSGTRRLEVMLQAAEAICKQWGMT